MCLQQRPDSLCLHTDKYSSQFGGGSQYAYFHEEDEASFQLVDTAKTQKTAYQRNRLRFAQVINNAQYSLTQHLSYCTIGIDVIWFIAVGYGFVRFNIRYSVILMLKR